VLDSHVPVPVKHGPTIAWDPYHITAGVALVIHTPHLLWPIIQQVLGLGLWTASLRGQKVLPSDIDALRRLCRGVLRACSSLSPNMRDWSGGDTIALMSVLSHDWQPSAEAMQPIKSNSTGLERRSSCNAPRQWSLKLGNTTAPASACSCYPRAWVQYTCGGCFGLMQTQCVWHTCTGQRPLPLISCNPPPMVTWTVDIPP
jgi:hypothetical protein